MADLSPSIFISHSSSDDGMAAYIAGRLYDLGVRVWIDHKDIGPGDDFVSRIEDALTDATHVLLLLSPHSVASAWVREERNIAQLFVIEGSKRLIPVLAPGFSPAEIPSLLRSRVYIDLNKMDLDDAIDAILVAIGRTKEKSAAAPRQVSAILVESIDILKGNKKRLKDVAIELLVTNSSRAVISIRQVGILISQPKHVQYLFAPPTMTYEIEIQTSEHRSGLREMLQHFAARFSANVPPVGDVRRFYGSVTEEDDNWSRPINAVLINAPYETRLTAVFPVHADIPPRERGRLRFAFSSRPLLQGKSYTGHLGQGRLIAELLGEASAEESIILNRLPAGKEPVNGLTHIILKDKNGVVSGATLADSSLISYYFGAYDHRLRRGRLIKMVLWCSAALVLVSIIRIIIGLPFVAKPLCEIVPNQLFCGQPRLTEVRQLSDRPPTRYPPRHEYTTTISGWAADDAWQHAGQRRAVARCVVLAVPPPDDPERGPVA
jgi:TIR domain